jgi:hypothetical protein
LAGLDQHSDLCGLGCGKCADEGENCDHWNGVTHGRSDAAISTGGAKVLRGSRDRLSFDVGTSDHRDCS